MAAYRATPREDRAKALAGVLLVHVALGAVILTGLNVENVRHVVEQLKTFDITEEPPPPPVPPPPQPPADRAKEEEGAAGKKAEPSPVVVPKPEIEVPAKPPVAAAPIAGTGSATRSGAANYGTGPGAGGTGAGRGGGGTGDFSGYTPARLIRNLNRGDYHQLAAGRLASGHAVVAITIDTSGLPATCRIIQSSGDPTVDAGLCPLVTRRLRFRPAMDAQRRPITYRLNYIADWSI
jgi:protein TonB